MGSRLAGSHSLQPSSGTNTTLSVKLATRNEPESATGFRLFWSSTRSASVASHFTVIAVLATKGRVHHLDCLWLRAR
jgi:hypothetical protein